MSKQIIENRSDLSDVNAMRLVKKVMQSGRISNNNKQYCYLTSFLIDGYNYHVATNLNKNSDKFIVYKVHKGAK